MALALYRTYRPGTLAEVIGQEHVTGPLARALDAGRVHHAYLFSGPRGCGKTSTARILARSLNCQRGPTAQPCGTCRSCVDLAPNGPGSVDVVELDAATHRSVDDARDLRERAVFAPAADRYKVYIIDEAHQLTSDAANALLKVIEEPPAHLRFVFATTEPDKIIPTIRSRTFHYAFRLVPTRVLAEHLAGVCAAEEVAAEPAALAVVARAGAGSVRDSLSVLGQLLAGAGPAGLTYADAVAALGLTDAEIIDEFVSALAAASPARMFALVDRVVSAGHDPRRFVADLLDRLRDLMVLRVDPDALDSGAVDIPDDQAQAVLSQAQSLGLAELSRAADLISSGLTDIRGATAPRLQLELLCARLALSAQNQDLATLVARVDRLERSVVPSAAGTPRPTPAPPPGPAAPPAAALSEGQAGAPPEAAPSAQARGASRDAGSGPSAPAGSAGGGEAAGDGAAGRSAPAAPQGRQAPPRRPQLSGPGPAAPPRRPVPPGSGAQRPAAPVQPGAHAASPPVRPAARPAGPEGEPHQPGRPSRAAAADPALDLAGVQRAWDSVLGRLGRASRVAWATFNPSAPLSLQGGSLAVAVADQGSLAAITQRGFDELLRQALIDVLGLDVSLDVVLDPDVARAPGGVGEAGPAAARPAGPAPAPPGPHPRAAQPGSPSAGPAAGQGPQPGPSRPPTTEGPDRAAQVLRGAQQRGEMEQPDEPSPDDPDLGASHGLELITRELGARPIGEIDHS